MYLLDLIFATNSKRGEKDVGEEAGAGGEGGDGAAIQVVISVGDQEVDPKRNACKDHKNPDRNSLIPANNIISSGPYD